MVHQMTLRSFCGSAKTEMFSRVMTLGVCLLAMSWGLTSRSWANGETDPTKVDADFAFQGEYLGDVTIEDAKIPVGVQIIAKGDGKFHLVGYPLGLPGDGWDTTRRHEVDATREGDTVTFRGDELAATLFGGMLKVVNSQGDTIGELKKVSRTSPTLNAQPPEGAVVLFDDKGTNKFPGGKVSPEGWMMQGATSEPTFEDFSMHLEFMLSYAPKKSGQGRSNSGLYLQGRHEVQILDSFGLEGKDNECGGIYTVASPAVNMCYPPLQWQTYDVDFTAARFDEAGKKTSDAVVNVRHNGVLIHKNVKVPKATTAAPNREGPTPGPIFLQDHGNEVRFRNIWVVPKAAK
jgi:hypothetical protein